MVTVRRVTSRSTAGRSLRTKFRHPVEHMASSINAISRRTTRRRIAIVKALSAICKDWFMWWYQFGLWIIWRWFHQPVLLLRGRILSLSLCTNLVTKHS